MIACRVETAMVNLIADPNVDSPDARRLLQDLFVTEAEILPDSRKNSLRISIHNASRPAANRILHKLLEKLNQTEIKYPGTDLTVVYELGG